MGDVLLVLAMLAAGFCVRWMFFPKIPAETASGAAIMAFGIFLLRSLKPIQYLMLYGKILAIILLTVWVLLMVSIIGTVFQGTFRKLHLANPVQIFGIGTWIAGTSVMENVLTQYFPQWMLLFRILAIMNALMWFYYIYLCLHAFRLLFQEPYRQRVHGIILLSTVSTQSLVLLFFNVFSGQVPHVINAGIIGFGSVLYILGFCLLVRRYAHLHQWRLTKDWPATNCIIHGAVSITGFAAASTKAVSPHLILAMWVWVVFWFIVVEGMESIRAILRIEKIGSKKGIGQFHVTQWSRIFTFGMFFAFTDAFHFVNLGLLDVIRAIVLDIMPWIVLILLINETLLYLKNRLGISGGETIGEKT